MGLEIGGDRPFVEWFVEEERLMKLFFEGRFSGGGRLVFVLLVLIVDPWEVEGRCKRR